MVGEKPDETRERMSPKRIQMSRQKPWRADHPDAVIVARPSKWGNPFKLGSRSGLAREPAIENPDKAWEYEGRISASGTRHDYHHPDGTVTVVNVRAMTLEETIECYRAYMTGGVWPLDWKRGSLIEEIRAELTGKDLACWCPVDQPCHADVLLEIANPEPSNVQQSPPPSRAQTRHDPT